MVTNLERKEIIKKFGKNENDSGSTAVQIALLTKRIETLAPHFEKNKLDFHSKRGLLKMIGSRRSLLRYLAKTSDEGYQFVIKELGLRK
ncbi:MAG: 30S ribosomal protein S15 [Bacteriovoracaceae bacterium]|nr:30S ribosomal protein S15 [Bacteriovoracaceae bacterium]